MFNTIFRMVMLTAECHEVIVLRMLKAARGGTAATEEAALMLSEKTEALARYGPAFMAGGSLDQIIQDYRGIVQANVLRLSRV